MKTIQVLVSSLLLAFLFIFSVPQASLAEQRIGVIMTGDIPYYGARHEAFVAELKKKGPHFADLEIILQRPFPDSI